MKSLTAVIKWLGRTRLAICILALTMSIPADPAAAQSMAEMEAMTNYQEAKADGRHAEAVKYLLDYMENDQGANAPMTISLMQRYGNLLREEGNIREAVDVLNEAHERGTAVYGEHGLELFELNLDLANAYVERDLGAYRPKQYFDAALEILRKNGQGSTVLYATTLVATASGLTQAGMLEGEYSADTRGGGFEELIASGASGVVRSYRSGNEELQKYLQEATELADTLKSEDPYLGSKIAVVQSKINVVATIFLGSVSPRVRGGITEDKARENYVQEDDRLTAAIEVLGQDASLNQEFLDIALNARMDIAWLNEDLNWMSEFCSSDSINMAGRYPPERLFEIAEDGTVSAPRFSFNIPGNIFRQLKTNVLDSRMRTLRDNNWGPNRNPGVKPAFVPVCIDGRLMAALVNAPRVEIEDIE